MAFIPDSDRRNYKGKNIVSRNSLSYKPITTNNVRVMEDLINDLKKTINKYKLYEYIGDVGLDDIWEKIEAIDPYLNKGDENQGNK